jgi:hypothetical protein
MNGIRLAKRANGFNKGIIAFVEEQYSLNLDMRKQLGLDK